MSRVTEIRARREMQFYKSRMRGNAQRQREDDRKLVEENQHLLPPSERYPVQKLAEADMDVDVEKVKESVEKRRREIEDMELSEEDEEVPALKQKSKTKLRRKVGGGVESMDVDA